MKRKIKAIVKSIFSTLEKLSPAFLTFHARPKKAAKFGLCSDVLVANSRIAIVIQGPILKIDNFTLETVRIYKKIFSSAVIILSTWASEDKEYLKKFESQNIQIILNQPPAEPGAAHINYQLVSTFAGIKKAKELGCEYALKTRTDLRVYAPNALEFLVNVIKKFPVAGNFKQRARIVGVSLNSFKYRRYGISDICLFGDIDDQLTNWSAAFDEKGSTLNGLKLGLPEVYLATEFLKKAGRAIGWTLADSWQALADSFIIVDEASLDLYWHKYARLREHRYVNYGAMRNDQVLDFKEWFNIYSNLANKKANQSQKMTSIIPC